MFWVFYFDSHLDLCRNPATTFTHQVTWLTFMYMSYLYTSVYTVAYCLHQQAAFFGPNPSQPIRLNTHRLRFCVKSHQLCWGYVWHLQHSSGKRCWPSFILKTPGLRFSLDGQKRKCFLETMTQTFTSACWLGLFVHKSTNNKPIKEQNSRSSDLTWMRCGTSIFQIVSFLNLPPKN